MRNVRLTLEYEGTAYAGWQIQENAVTIQGVLEAALERLLEHRARLSASGRTDAGVHALGQTANFCTHARLPLRGVLWGLNGLLPPDIRVRRADEMPADFDSRRSARSKVYQYFLHVGATPSAFARHTSWRVGPRLDLAAMAEATRLLVGSHDFGGFRAAGCGAAKSVRTLRDAWLLPRGEFAEIGVCGTGFLRHMVRIVVGTLVEVGFGKRRPSGVAELLARADRALAGPTAPPRGLFLKEVHYDVEPLEAYP